MVSRTLSVTIDYQAEDLPKHIGIHQLGIQESFRPPKGKYFIPRVRGQVMSQGVTITKSNR